jgi:small subunit ribosomal protein S2
MATVDVDPALNGQPDTKKTNTKSTSETKYGSNGVDIKKLLEAGAHFGHKTSRWHPKMAPYIHSKREGSHIIDLTKTVSALEKALDFLNETSAAGKQILLVSTKRQAKDKVKEVALATNNPYVVERWLGGMLTNTSTINGRIKHLKDLETRMVTGELAARYNKLEVQRFQEEIDSMNLQYGGIKELHAKPGAVFVVDVLNDINAVKEAKKLRIPVVALTDTNVDPTQVDYAIPCNDDAAKTITLILDYVQQAITTGQAKSKKPVDKTEKKEEPEAEKPAKINKDPSTNAQGRGEK